MGWDDFDHESPENSILHAFSENDIVGLGISIIDNDVGTDNDTDRRFAAWRMGGQRCGKWRRQVHHRLHPAASADGSFADRGRNDSWGHIKASYMQQ